MREVARLAGKQRRAPGPAAGERDIANVPSPPLPIAIQNAGLDDLRVISDDFQDGNAGYYSNEFMVLADGPIKRVEDLKGKVGAVNASGSASDIAVRAMLRRHDLEAHPDYPIIGAPVPAVR